MIRKIALFSVASFAVACGTTEPVAPVYKGTQALYGVSLDNLSAAAYSIDGRFAAVGNSTDVWLLNPDTLTVEHHFSNRVRPGTNNTLVFIGEDRIASTGQGTVDGTAAIYIWDLGSAHPGVTEIPVPQLDPHVISIAWSESTGMIAAGGENGQIVLIDSSRGGGFDQRLVPDFGGAVLAMEFSKDGLLLAAAGAYYRVIIWNTETLQPIGALPVELPISDLDVIPGKQSLLIAGKDLQIWKFEEQDEVGDLANPGMAGDAVIMGSLAAFLVASWSVRLPLDPSGGFGGAGREPYYGFCRRVTAISHDGALLADVHPGLTHEKIRIIDVDTGKTIKKLNPKGGKTCGLAFSPGGDKLLVANSRVARLYDTGTWEFDDFSLEE